MPIWGFGRLTTGQLNDEVESGGLGILLEDGSYLIFEDGLYAIQDTGGGAGTFSPTDVPNLELWCRSDLGVTLVGNNVSIWEDQSGAENDLLQAVDADRPQFLSGQLNGKGIIRFDPATDELLSTAALTMNQPFTIYAVVKQVGWASSGYIWSEENVSPPSICLWQDSNGVEPDIEVYAGIADIIATNGMTLATWYITRTVLNTPNSSFRLNNESSITGDVGANNWTAQFKLGHTTQSAGFDIAEVLVYSAAVSDADDADIMTYLNNRYAIYI